MSREFIRAHVGGYVHGALVFTASAAVVADEQVQGGLILDVVFGECVIEDH